MRHPFVDFDALESFLTSACDQYEKTAPTVHEYCDQLYARLQRPADVSLLEIVRIRFLLADDVWMQPNYAANYVYHLQEELGQVTTGQAGF